MYSIRKMFFATALIVIFATLIKAENSTALSLLINPAFAQVGSIVNLTWSPFGSSTNATIILHSSINDITLSVFDNGFYQLSTSDLLLAAYNITLRNDQETAEASMLIFKNYESLIFNPDAFAVYCANHFGRNTDEFSSVSSIKSPTTSGNGIDPGIYTANVINTLSSGNSSDFIVYSDTGLNVSIENSGTIISSSNLLVTWTPAANVFTYNATLVLVNASDPSVMFTGVNMTDNGSSTVSILSLGDPLPGFYKLIVDGTLGSGLSQSFPIASVSPLNVTLSSNSSAVNSTINFTWTPFDTLGTANISLIWLSNNTLIPVASNITDNGSLLIQLDYAPGAYLVIVNTSIGNGSSSILEVTTTLSVSVSPSNISSANESTNVTWTPFNAYQTNVDLIIYNGSNVVYTTSIPNNGSYSLALNVSSGLYNVTVVSDIGSGSADLIVYSFTGLSITFPDNTSLLYTNTTDAPFIWSPSDPLTGSVMITLTDLNTNQTFTLNVLNTGSASVNISAFDLPPSSYQAIIDSALGSGLSSDFVIQSPFALVVIQPNASTNISEVEQLNVSWTPSNPIGSNGTITLYDLSCPPKNYQFSVSDNGNATINLATQIVNKALFTPFTTTLVTLPTIKETPNHRQIIKNYRI